MFSFAESPRVPGVLWAGTDDGSVHLSRDGGGTWQAVTPSALPEWATVTVVEPSPHDPATAYICAHSYRLQDRAPYLFKTDDYGNSWIPITSGIDEFTRVVRADPVRAGLLYAGTETQAYVSLDDGASWHPLRLNMPAVPIYDLVVKDADLVAASHGRGFWILDDVTPLREAPSEGVATLCTPPPVYRYPTPAGPHKAKPGKNYVSEIGAATFVERVHPDGRKEHIFLDAGTNPPDGVTISYLLAIEPAADAIELSFLDATGDVVAAFSPAADEPGDGAGTEKGEDAELPEKRWWERLPREPGLNRFAWDLRSAGARSPRDAKGRSKTATGHLVPPGRYEVRLRLGSDTFAVPLELRRDPRLAATDAELIAQYGLLREIRDRQNEISDALDRARHARGQAEAWGRRADAGGELTAKAKEVASSLRAAEERLTNPKVTDEADRLKLPAGLDAKFAELLPAVAEADAPPTQQCRDVFAKLCEDLDRALGELARVLRDDLGELNVLIAGAALPAITADLPGHPPDSRARR